MTSSRPSVGGPRAIARWSDLPAAGHPRYAALGTFDGVHRGHVALIGRMAQDAKVAGAIAIACAFDPHPLTVLRPEHVPPMLSSTEEKVARLYEAGADVVLLRRFDENFAQMMPREYVQRELCHDAGLVRVYVGANFTFGRGGKGTADDLRVWGGDLCGLGVVVLDLAGQEVWSSTRARRAIEAGDLATATECLGRPYSLRATVQHGDKRGRTLGFPTANLAVASGRAMPPPGIYAGRARTQDGDEYRAAISWGRRPTFGGGDLLLEVFLLDFSGDLYGRGLEVFFVRKLREERTFATVSELVAQMRRDVADVRDRTESD